MKASIVNIVKPLVERFPKLARAYRTARDSWPPNELLVTTPYGFKMTGPESMTSGRFEEQETRLVQRILKESDLVVNVGANIGYYCCIALQCKKDVIAFEPVTSNVQMLLKNIEGNNWESFAEVYSMAVSDRIGVVKIYGARTGASLVPGWAGTPESYYTLVPSTTLNNVLGTRLSGKRVLLVIDIEGAENDLLKGASEILTSKPKPIWMVEICISEHQPEGERVNPNLVSTFEKFWNNGYEAWTVEARPIPVTPADVNRVAATGDNIFDTHNFLFLERGKGETVLLG